MSEHVSEELIATVAETVRGVVHRDHPIGPMTTYRVGGAAALYVEPADAADLEVLADLLATAEEEDPVPTVVVGLGSNMLVADSGFDGVAIHLGSGFSDLTIDGSTVFAGGALALPLVARQTVRAGLTGFEWAVGVPGSVGGAVRMNAGGHGSDMHASVVAADVVNLRTGIRAVWLRDSLGFGYRTSRLDRSDCVVSCTLALELGDTDTGSATLSEIVRWRREHQPGGQNAGSVFTNPPEDSAGRLIDAAGGKGLRVGSAEVSSKHANFIQADIDGSADDVLALMVAVRDLVEADADVRLHAETHLVGYPSPNPFIQERSS